MAKHAENVCRWIRLARERNERDLWEGPKRGLWFDEEAAQRAVDFFPLMTLWEGKHAGQPFKPMKWAERDIIRPLFGWKRLPKGMTPKDALKIPLRDRHRPEIGIFRRFRTLYLAIPRKNTKTILGAGIGIYGLIADGEPGAQIYSAATKYDQARIMFDCARNLIESSEHLTTRAEVMQNSIFVEHWRSVFKPMGANYKKEDGKRPHYSLVDEYHEHPTRSLVEKLETGQASDQSLMGFFTTAGDNRHSPCFKEHQYAIHILEGRFKNDSYLAVIYSADEGDDWKDRRVWEKCNPGLGVSIPREIIEKQFAEAKQRPTMVNAFKRYRLNIWVNVASAWIKWECWKACAGKIDLEELKETPCYVGIDLSRTIDLTAMGVVWPGKHFGDGKWRVLTFQWVPEDRIPERVENDKVEYDVWHREGHLAATPGNVVDYDFVGAKLKELMGVLNVQGVGYDPYNATQFVNDMQGEGIENLVEVRQGAKTLSAPAKEFERCVLGGKLVHPDNPVLNWAVSNVVVTTDSNENIKPDKKKSTERIDPVAAIMTAWAVAYGMEGQQGSSIYESGEVSI